MAAAVPSPALGALLASRLAVQNGGCEVAVWAGRTVPRLRGEAMCLPRSPALVTLTHLPKPAQMWEGGQL